MNTAPKLKREAFATSRLAEFSNKKEHVVQTGTPAKDWLIYLLKRLTNDALYACEEGGRAGRRAKNE